MIEEAWHTADCNPYDRDQNRTKATLQDTYGMHMTDGWITGAICYIMIYRNIEMRNDMKELRTYSFTYQFPLHPSLFT
jgi:hypothetical protein